MFSRQNCKITFSTETIKSHFCKSQNCVFSLKPQNHVFPPKPQNHVFVKFAKLCFLAKIVKSHFLYCICILYKLNMKLCFLQIQYTKVEILFRSASNPFRMVYFGFGQFELKKYNVLYTALSFGHLLDINIPIDISTRIG